MPGNGINNELEALRHLLVQRRQLQPQLQNALKNGRLDGHEIFELHREITVTLGHYVATILKSLPGHRDSDPWFIWPGYRWLSDESKGPQRFDIRELSTTQIEQKSSIKDLSTRQVGWGTKGSNVFSTAFPLVLWMRAIYDQNLGGVQTRGFTEWWDFVRQLANPPIAVEISAKPLGDRDDRILSVELTPNAAPGVIIRTLNDQMSEQWSRHGMTKIPSFPIISSNRVLDPESERILEQLWEGLLKSMICNQTGAQFSSSLEQLNQLCLSIERNLGPEWRESVEWLRDTLAEVPDFKENLNPLDGVFVGNFDFYYTFPLESCFPMLRGSVVDDNLGTLNLYTSVRVPASTLEGIAHAGRMLLEPLRMLEVLADRERKDWHTVFGHVRHDLDKGVQMIRREIKEIRNEIEDKKSFEFGKLESHMDVIQGSIGTQKSLYDALEAYATIVRSYSSGMIAQSQEILRDKATAINISETLKECMQEAACRRLYDIKFSRGKTGQVANYECDISPDLEKQVALRSRPVLILLLVELLVNAHKYVFAGTDIQVKARIIQGHCEITIKNRSSLVESLMIPDNDSVLPLCKWMSKHKKCSAPNPMLAAGMACCEKCASTWMRFNLNSHSERLALGEGSGVGLSQLRVFTERVLNGTLKLSPHKDEHGCFPYVVEAILRFPIEVLEEK